jgi:two-component system sensor histidine kinase CreC
MHVAAPVLDRGRIIGVLAVAKSNQSIQPFITASQDAILRQGWWLLGLSFLVGIVVALWLSNALARLGRFARAVTAGEKVEAPDLGRNEIGELGRALDTMRLKLDGKQYVEQYVQTLAHEMKSPLSAIRAAAEILEDAPPGAERERFLANIREQSLRMGGMIDKLLALAAVEHRQALQDVEDVDCAALAREAASLAGPHATRKGIALQVEAEQGLPSARGERFLLLQALGNLVDNALDFSPPGATVRILAGREGRELSLRVLDEGVGIPDYARERVFERFYSLPRPDGSRSSGLGLGFVREVAALHHGRASLQPRPEGGVQAELRLPLD